MGTFFCLQFVRLCWDIGKFNNSARIGDFNAFGQADSKKLGQQDSAFIVQCFYWIKICEHRAREIGTLTARYPHL